MTVTSLWPLPDGRRLRRLVIGDVQDFCRGNAFGSREKFRSMKRAEVINMPEALMLPLSAKAQPCFVFAADQLATSQPFLADIGFSAGMIRAPITDVAYSVLLAI